MAIVLPILSSNRDIVTAGSLPAVEPLAEDRRRRLLAILDRHGPELGDGG